MGLAKTTQTTRLIASSVYISLDIQDRVDYLVKLKIINSRAEFYRNAIIESLIRLEDTDLYKEMIVCMKN